MFPNAQDALPLPRGPNLERYKKPAKNEVKAGKPEEKTPADAVLLMRS